MKIKITATLFATLFVQGVFAQGHQFADLATVSPTATFTDNHLCFSDSRDIACGDRDFVVTPDGNVGIGAGALAEKLTVSGNIRIQDSSNSYGMTITPSSVNNTTTINPNYGGGNIGLVTSSGNVGIGTTDPNGKLHVHSGSAGTVTAHLSMDELTIEASGDGGMSILQPNTARGFYSFGNTDDNYRAGIDYDHSTDQMRLYSNNKEAFLIDSSGDVGIGTIAPSNKLTVAGDLSATTINATELCDEDGGNCQDLSNGITASAAGSDGYLQFNSSNALAATNTLVWDNTNARLGVGTSEPEGKLDILGMLYQKASPGSSIEVEQIRLGRSDNDIRYHSIYSSHSNNDASNYLQFRVHDKGGTPYISQSIVMTMLGSGYVGIGTTAPTAAMEVSGSAKIAGIVPDSACTDNDDRGIIRRNSTTGALQICRGDRP